MFATKDKIGYVSADNIIDELLRLCDNIKAINEKSKHILHISTNSQIIKAIEVYEGIETPLTRIIELNFLGTYVGWDGHTTRYRVYKASLYTDPTQIGYNVDINFIPDDVQKKKIQKLYKKAKELNNV